MRNLRLYITPLVLVPLVFSGMSVLASLLIFSSTRAAIQQHQDPFWPVAFWTLLVSALALLFGLLVVWMYLRPIRGLADAVESFAGEGDEAPSKSKSVNGRDDDLVRFKRVSDRVTELLSRMEVKKLFPDIIETCTSMRRLLSLVARIAPSDASVLIMGESGTGKELIAQSLHGCSDRADHPFVAVNCAGIPEMLLESELFGHEKGAFTGAAQRKLGKFERAQGGTVFLDEIGDMPLNTQAKLLRVLQEKEIERVGGTATIPVDVRFVAATNKNLSQMVAEGAFREDLYFRINACSLEIPPLRSRTEDIPPLIDFFISQMGVDTVISPTAMHLLMIHNWPGNVRELKNVIETACVLAESSIEPEHLPSEFAGDICPMKVFQTVSSGDDKGIDQAMEEMEKSLILSALRQAGAVQKHAAKILGIKERSLWHRISKYNIDVAEIRESLG